MAPPAGDYPLEMLLKVRNHREECARKAEEDARRTVRNLQKAQEAARTRVNDFRLWRKEEEHQRYAGILGMQLDKKALDSFRAGLAALAEQEMRLEDTLHELTEQLSAAQEEEQQKTALLRQAVKDSIRIQEHRALWSEEDLRQEEHRENRELES